MVTIEYTDKIQCCPKCGWENKNINNKLDSGKCPECEHKPLHIKSIKHLDEE